MHVFVTGAGGYIGGTVASRLVQAGHTVTGLIRDPAKSADLARLGIQPVVATLDDATVLTEHARRSDAVVNAADSDHRAAAETLIEALAGSGKPLIHTSGSSTVGVGTDGEVSEAVFPEETLDPESTWEPAHPVRTARVAIDRLVLTAAEKGIRATVLSHSLIYGHGHGAARDSILIAELIRQAHASGIVQHVGPGRNIWSTVHIEDVADVYLLALEKSPPGTFYFVANGEASLAAITEALARSLGLPGPRPWDPDSPKNVWNHQFALHALGSNSRVRATRARDLLGWQPQHHSITEWITETHFTTTESS